MSAIDKGFIDQSAAVCLGRQRVGIEVNGQLVIAGCLKWYEERLCARDILRGWRLYVADEEFVGLRCMALCVRNLIQAIVVDRVRVCNRDHQVLS